MLYYNILPNLMWRFFLVYKHYAIQGVWRSGFMAPRIVKPWVLICQSHTPANFATLKDLFFLDTVRVEDVWTSEQFWT